MIYKFYKTVIENGSFRDDCFYRTEDVKDALLYAGELIDIKDDNFWISEISPDSGSARRIEAMDFINNVHPFERDLSPAECEILDNMDRAEIREVIRSAPTQIILEELANRCAWMENKINEIYKIVMN